MLKITDIHAYYGNIRALSGISLEINKGEIITLIGANGAGKSTTLMSICGILKITKGSIIFEDQDISNLPSHQIVAKGICQVPEGRRIFPHLTVLENLHMGAYLRDNRQDIDADLQYVFDLFPILSQRRKQVGGTLSGGEQQMLAISRAIMARPKLLLLDEPSLGLAPIIVQQIFDIIKRINEENQTTIFLVEQNANMALKLAHRAYVLQTGSVVQSGTARSLLEDDKIREAYLGI